VSWTGYHILKSFIREQFCFCSMISYYARCLIECDYIATWCVLILGSYAKYNIIFDRFENRNFWCFCMVAEKSDMEFLFFWLFKSSRNIFTGNTYLEFFLVDELVNALGCFRKKKYWNLSETKLFMSSYFVFVYLPTDLSLTDNFHKFQL
jgi:hypothetical protein